MASFPSSSSSSLSSLKIALVHNDYDDLSNVHVELNRMFSNDNSTIVLNIDSNKFVTLIKDLFVSSYKEHEFQKKFYEFVESLDASAKINFYKSELKSALDIKNRSEMDMLLKKQSKVNEKNIVQIVNCGSDEEFALCLSKEYSFSIYYINSDVTLLYDKYVEQNGIESKDLETFKTINKIKKIEGFIYDNPDNDYNYLSSKIFINEKDKKRRESFTRAALSQA